MLTPKDSFLGKQFWNRYIKYIIHADFKGIHISRKPQISLDKSVLVLSNHFSWWDGFFVWQLNRMLLNKKYHVMMLEEQLKKNSFLRTAGAFSIDRSNMRKAITSLNYAAELLEDSGNMVLMFPQGQIESQHVNKPSFRSGVVRIAQKVTAPFDIVFCINLIDYFSDRKPIIQSYLREYEGPLELESMRKAFYSHYEDCKKSQGKLIS